MICCFANWFRVWHRKSLQNTYLRQKSIHLGKELDYQAVVYLPSHSKTLASPRPPILNYHVSNFHRSIFPSWKICPDSLELRCQSPGNVPPDFLLLDTAKMMVHSNKWLRFINRLSALSSENQQLALPSHFFILKMSGSFSLGLILFFWAA